MGPSSLWVSGLGNLESRKSQATALAKGKQVWNSAAVEQTQGGSIFPVMGPTIEGRGWMLGCVVKGMF